MSGFVREHLRPLAGAAVFHVALLLLLSVAALRWTAQQPPVQLAIEGVVVDARDLAAARNARQAATPKPEPSTPPEPAAEPPMPDRSAEQKAAAEQQAREQADRERETALKLERDAEAARVAEHQRAEEARERTEAAARKAEQQAQERAAADAKRKQEAEQREAKLQAAREAELQRGLAAEEEAAAVARSGVVDEYRRVLIETIQRNWNRPPSARAGLECTLNVTQAPGGTVIDVQLGACNGDAAVRESITNAVFRSSPLPPPRDPRAFERRLVIVFKPTE